MAASDHLHPVQLQMFMRPQEVLDTMQGSVEQRDMSMIQGHLTHKLREAKIRGEPYLANHDGELIGQGPSLYDQVKTHGVEKPIILQHTENYRGDPMLLLGNGHHRLAAAQAAEQETGQQQYIPVIHDDNYMGSSRTKDTFGVAED